MLNNRFSKRYTMKKLFSILVVTFILPLLIVAQSKFSFETGIRLRVTPVYLKKTSGFITDPRLILMQQDAHINGLSVLAGLRYKVNNRLSAGIKVFLRYDELFAELNLDSNFNNKYVNRLMVDYGIYGLYKIVETEKYNINAGLGLTFCNKNTNYSYNYYQLIPFTTTYEKITGASDFNFSTLDLPIEYERNRFRFGLTTSISNKHKFYVHPGDFLLFNLSVAYTIPLHSKKNINN